MFDQDMWLYYTRLKQRFFSSTFFLDPRPSAKFSGKMHKFLRSLAEYLVSLAFLYCCYIFDLYITCLTLSFSNVYMYFHLHQFCACLQSWIVIISATFKCILSQFRCSLEPKRFFRGTAGVSDYPQTPRLCWPLLHSLFCRLYSLLGSCVIVAHRAPDWRKPATHKHFFFFKTNLFKEWMKKKYRVYA